MVNTYSHDRDKSVTSLPVLVPTAGEQPDGHVLFLEGRVTKTQPVRRFVVNDGAIQTETLSKRFVAISNMCSLASGKRRDYPLLRESLRILVEDAFETEPWRPGSGRE